MSKNPRTSLLAKLIGIKLTVFNSTSLCLQSGLMMLKAGRKAKFKGVPQGPLYEIPFRENLKSELKSQINNHMEAQDIENTVNAINDLFQTEKDYELPKGEYDSIKDKDYSHIGNH